jgi:formylglycine-generating enzyme required for sulfatase activity
VDTKNSHSKKEIVSGEAKETDEGCLTTTRSWRFRFLTLFGWIFYIIILVSFGRYVIPAIFPNVDTGNGTWPYWLQNRAQHRPIDDEKLRFERTLPFPRFDKDRRPFTNSLFPLTPLVLPYSGESDDSYQDRLLVPADLRVIVQPSITNTIGMKLKEIPAGIFLMGSPDDEEGREDGEHLHQVTITKPFYMQTTEVTQSQWKAEMGTEPWIGKEFVKEGANFPAVYVSWDDAVAFCKKLSAKEGKKYRLPTEAEWEYACRAGTKKTWSFGGDEKKLGDYAWYGENAWDMDELYAHQVELKKPNAFGLYDMHGNVGEWCHNYYDRYNYKKSPEKDPAGPTSGVFHVLRGGSWDRLSRYTRSAYRNGNVAGRRYHSYGFRLVRELD